MVSHETLQKLIKFNNSRQRWVVIFHFCWILLFLALYNPNFRFFFEIVVSFGFQKYWFHNMKVMLKEKKSKSQLSSCQLDNEAPWVSIEWQSPKWRLIIHFLFQRVTFFIYFSAEKSFYLGAFLLIIILLETCQLKVILLNDVVL
jgi:hypothetical protein